MGLLLLFFVICLYQLAERSDRQGWLWALGYVAVTLTLQRTTVIGGMADFLTFVIALVLMVATTPTKRKW